MFLSKIIRLPKHKRFEYSPRYYNPEQEELEKRTGSRPGTGEKAKTRLREDFERIRNSSLLAKQKQQSNMRLLIIILLLGALVYILLH